MARNDVIHITAEVEAQMKGMDKLQSQFKGLSLPNDGKVGEQFDKAYSSLAKTKEMLDQVSSKGGNIKVGDMDKITNQFSKANSEINKLGQSLGKLTMKQAGSSLGSTMTGIQKEAQKTAESIKNSMTNATKTLSGSSNFSKMFKGFEGSFAKLNTKDASQFKNQIDQIRTSLQGLQTQSTKSFSVFGKTKSNQGLQETQNAINNMLKYLDQAEAKIDSTMSKVNRGDFSGLNGSVQALDQITKGANSSSQAVGKLSTEFNKVSSASKNLDTLTSQATSMVSNFFSVYSVVDMVRRGVSSAFDAVKELDKAMAEQAVVTDYSIGDLWGQLPEYTKQANSLGVAISDVYNATTLYTQQGLDANTSMGVGVETMKMARIAGMEATQATNAMTAALRGFNMEVNQANAQKVNDVYSQVAAKTASDVTELSTATEKVASLASASGMNVESTVSFLAQMIETTREAPENLGTALKTIIARFQQIKTDPLERFSDESGEYSYNSVETALNTIGVSLVDATGNFRAFDDVIFDVAKKWDGLSQAQQKYIATQAAGSRQQSRFIALVSNLDRLEEIQGYATDSKGASQKQFDKTLDSLETKTQRLKNTFDEFSMSFMNSTMIKGSVDALNGFVGMFTKIDSAISKLGTGAGTTFAKMGVGIAAVTGMLKIGFGGAQASLVNLAKAYGNVIKNGTVWGNQIKDSITEPFAQSSTGQYSAMFGSAKEVMAQVGKTDLGIDDLVKVKDVEGSKFEGDFGKAFDSILGGKNLKKQFAQAGKNYNSDLQKSIKDNFKENLKDTIVDHWVGEVENAAKDAKTNSEKPWKQIAQEAKENLKEGFKGTGMEGTVDPMIDNIAKRIEATGKHSPKLKEMGKELGEAVADHVGNNLEQVGLDLGEKVEKNMTKGAVDAAKSDKEGLAEAVVSATEGSGVDDDTVKKFAGDVNEEAGKNATVNLTQFGQKAQTAMMGVAAAAGVAAVAIGTINSRYREGIDMAEQYGSASLEASNMASGATQGLGVAAGMAGAAAGAFMINPILGAVVAAVGAIASIVAGIQGYETAQEEARKATVDAGKAIVDNYKTQTQTFESNKGTIQDLQSEYKTLSQGVSENGKNLSLTADEYKRYQEIAQQLVSISPDVVKGYDEQGKAILKQGADMIALQSIQQQHRKEQEQFIKDGDKVYKSVEAAFDEKTLKKNLNAARQDYASYQKYAEGYGGLDAANKYIGLSTANLSQGSNNLRGVMAQNAVASNNYRKELQQIDGATSQLGKSLKKVGYDMKTEDPFKDLSSVNKYVEALNNARTDMETTSSTLSEKEKEKQLEEADKQIERAEKVQSKMEEAYQPLLDWGNSYLQDIASQQTKYSNLDFSAMQAGYEEVIMSSGSVEELKKNTTSYLDTLQSITQGTNKYNKEYAKSTGKSAKSFEDSQKIIEDAQKKLDENKDIYPTKALDEFNKKVQQEKEYWTELAESIEDPALKSAVMDLAEGLELSANGAVNLTEAFNPLMSGVQATQAWKDQLEEVTKNDYYSGNKNVMGTYDTIMTEENKGGYGSKTFWKGASQILGDSVLKSLNYDIDKVEPHLKSLKPIFEAGEKGADAMANLLVENKRNLEQAGTNGEGLKINTEDGMFAGMENFSENLQSMADTLGLSKEALSSSLYNMGQWYGGTYSDPGMVKLAMAQEGVGLMYQGKGDKGESAVIEKSDLEAMMLQNGVPAEKIQDEIEDMNEHGIHVIDTEKGGGNVAKQLTDEKELEKNGLQSFMDSQRNKEGKLDATSLANNLAKTGMDKQVLKETLQGLNKRGEFSGEDSEKLKDNANLESLVDSAMSGDIEQYKTNDTVSSIDGNVASIAGDMGTLAGFIANQSGTLSEDQEKKYDETVGKGGKDGINEYKQTMWKDPTDSSTRYAQNGQLTQTGQNYWNKWNNQTQPNAQGYANLSDSVGRFTNFQSTLATQKQQVETALSNQTEGTPQYKELQSKLNTLNASYANATAMVDAGTQAQKEYKQRMQQASKSQGKGKKASDRLTVETNKQANTKKRENTASSQYSVKSLQKTNQQSVGGKLGNWINKVTQPSKVTTAPQLTTPKIDTSSLQASAKGGFQKLLGSKKAQEIKVKAKAEVGDVQKKISSLAKSGKKAIKMKVEANVSKAKSQVNSIVKAGKKTVKMSVSVATGAITKAMGLMKKLNSYKLKSKPMNVISNAASVLGTLGSINDTKLENKEVTITTRNITINETRNVTSDGNTAAKLAGKDAKGNATYANLRTSKISSLAEGNVDDYDDSYDDDYIASLAQGNVDKQKEKDKRDIKQDKIDKLIGSMSYGNVDDSDIDDDVLDIPSYAGGKLGPNGHGGLTLTGELGPEIAWLPSDGSARILGQGGPELTYLPKDAVVYNDKQTKRIVSRGGIAPSTIGSLWKGIGSASKMGPKKDSSSSSGNNGGGNTKKSSGDTVINTDKATVNSDKTTTDGGNKDKSHWGKIEKKGNVNEYLYNQEQRINEAIRKRTKLQEAYTRAENELKTTLTWQLNNLNAQIKNIQLQKKYQKQLMNWHKKHLKQIDKKKVVKVKTSQHKYNKKGKRTSKVKQKKVNLGKYIKQDKNGAYIIDYKKLNKDSKDKTYKNNVVNKIKELLDKYQGGYNDASNTFESLETELDSLNDQKEKLKWEFPYDKVWRMTQAIQTLSNKVNVLSKRLSIMQKGYSLTGLMGGMGSKNSIQKQFKSLSSQYLKAINTNFGVRSAAQKKIATNQRKVVHQGGVVTGKTAYGKAVAAAKKAKKANTAAQKKVTGSKAGKNIAAKQVKTANKNVAKAKSKIGKKDQKKLTKSNKKRFKQGKTIKLTKKQQKKLSKTQLAEVKKYNAAVKKQQKAKKNQSYMNSSFASKQKALLKDSKKKTKKGKKTQLNKILTKQQKQAIKKGKKVNLTKAQKKKLSAKNQKKIDNYNKSLAAKNKAKSTAKTAKVKTAAEKRADKAAEDKTGATKASKTLSNNKALMKVLTSKQKKALKNGEPITLTKAQIKKLGGSKSSIVQQVSSYTSKAKKANKLVNKTATKRLKDYFTYDKATGEYKAKTNKNGESLLQRDLNKGLITQEQGAEIEKLVNENNDLANQAAQAMEDQLEAFQSWVEMYEQALDQDIDGIEKLRDAFKEAREHEISRLEGIKEAIDSANSRIIDKMQQQINEQRQARENDKTEKTLREKQERLAYLRQDTSGKNAVAIKQLEEELKNETESYHDQLVDQRMEQYQKNLDEAAQQRQQQIDTLKSIESSVLTALGDNGIITEIIAGIENNSAKLPQDTLDAIGKIGDLGTISGENAKTVFSEILSNAAALNSPQTMWEELKKDNEIRGLIEGIKQATYNQQKTGTDTDLSAGARALALHGNSIDAIDAVAGSIAQGAKDVTLEQLKTLLAKTGGIQKFIDSGYNSKSAEKMGLSLKDLAGLGASASQLKTMGYSLSDMKKSGEFDKGTRREEVANLTSDAKEMASLGYNAGEIAATKKYSWVNVLNTGKFSGTDLKKWKDDPNLKKALVSVYKSDPAKLIDYWKSLGIVSTPANTKSALIKNGVFKDGEEKKIIKAIVDSSSFTWEDVFRASSTWNPWRVVKTFINTENARKAFDKVYEKDVNDIYKKEGKASALAIDKIKSATAYKTGGLADFTGPAWLDGTKAKPEAVLNAKQTAAFIQLSNSLADVTQKAASSKNTAENQTNNYEININVDEIANDYDVDKLQKRIEQNLLQKAGYRNINRVSNRH